MQVALLDIRITPSVKGPTARVVELFGTELVGFTVRFWAWTQGCGTGQARKGIGLKVRQIQQGVLFKLGLRIWKVSLRLVIIRYEKSRGLSALLNLL